LLWVLDQRSRDCLKVEPAIDICCHQRSRRQGPVRRIGDDPKRRERNPMLDGDPRRHMRLHVDRNRTRLFIKPSLCMGADNGYVSSGDIAQ